MSNIKYSLKRSPAEGDKVTKTPQVKVILKHLTKVGHQVDRDELIKSVDNDPEFKSRQGAAKILNFYMPRLVEAGIVDKHATAAEKKEPKKAATSRPGEAKAA